MSMLASMLAAGDGVPTDRVRARDILRRVCEGGDRESAGLKALSLETPH